MIGLVASVADITIASVQYPEVLQGCCGVRAVRGVVRMHLRLAGTQAGTGKNLRDSESRSKAEVRHLDFGFELGSSFGTTQEEETELLVAVAVLERREREREREPGPGPGPEPEPALEPVSASVCAFALVVVRRFAFEADWVLGPDEAIATVPCCKVAA